MAYTIGAALPIKSPAPAPAQKKPTTLAPKAAAPAKAPVRQVKQLPPPVPPRNPIDANWSIAAAVADPKKYHERVLERLKLFVARESLIRQGVKELTAAAQEAGKKVTSTKVAAAAAVAALRLRPTREAAKTAAAAVRAAASAAADLKAIKNSLLVWTKGLSAAKEQTAKEHRYLLGICREAAKKTRTPLPPAPPPPSETPAVVAADKQAEAVAAQVAKDTEQAVASVASDAKTVVAESKTAAPEVAAEVAAEVKEAVKEAEAATEGAVAESKGLPVPLLLAAAVGGFLLMRK